FVVDGQFHVAEVVGEGGFSVVYKGTHLGLKEPIAIKCLKLKTKSKDPRIIESFTQRFWDESRIMYRLSQGNLNIVRAMSTGSTLAPATGEVVPYMILEWLEGQSLAAELRARRQGRLGGRPIREVLAAFDSAAMAIAYAHTQGIVHRDVKPGNLFMADTPSGRTMKVLDFGMAKILEPQAMGGMQGAMTIGSVMVVSPQYATPEQVDPSVGAIGPWTDVYSFAIVLLEALMDRRVRTADNFADLIVEIMDKTRAISLQKLGLRLGDPIERVFAAALAVRPDQRPKDMGAFWTALKDAVASTPAVLPAAGGFDEVATKTDLAAPPVADLRAIAAPVPAAGNPAPKPMGQTLPLSSMRPAEIAAVASGSPARSFAQTAPLTARASALPQPQPAPPPAPAPQYAPPAPQYGPPPAQMTSSPRLSQPQGAPAFVAQPAARERPSQPNFPAVQQPERSSQPNFAPMAGQGGQPEAQRWTPPPYTPPQPPPPAAQQAPPRSMLQPPAASEPSPPPRRSPLVTVVIVFIVLATLASLGILAYVLVLPHVH
ncbi:MAG TPA: protein kinase, partial [Polyangiaceae bacterium]